MTNLIKRLNEKEAKRIAETESPCIIIEGDKETVDEMIEALKTQKCVVMPASEENVEFIDIEAIKFEAYKEFAERVKALLPNDGMSPEGRFKFGRIKSLDIDNILKEMG